MPTYQFPIIGAEKLRKQLAALGPRIAKKVIRQSLRQAGKLVQAEAKSNAPVDTGRLKKSIRVRALKRSRRERVGINVRTTDTDNLYVGKQFYGAFQEFGFRRGKRTAAMRRVDAAAPKKSNRGRKRLGREADNRPIVPAQPFLKPAFESKKNEAGKLIIENLRAGIEREASK